MHEIQFILQTYPIILSSLIFIIGLLVGSFLNVVIYRLPIMMEKTWQKECIECLKLEPIKNHNYQEEIFNLFIPRSRCPQCFTPIKLHQNIPVISYLLLQGQCAVCQSAIALRYPLLEVLTGITSAMVAWHFGYSIGMVFALLLTWSLLILSFIDIDYQLLPDAINLPILWLGLCLSLFSVYTDTYSSVIGAITGYLSLWTVYQLFKLITGKEGMGYGDFKLLALLGAWLGWQYLPLIILFSSLLGAIIGITMIIFAKRDSKMPIPFGPYLAVAGWLALIWGEQINTLYLSSIGS